MLEKCIFVNDKFGIYAIVEYMYIGEIGPGKGVHYIEGCSQREVSLCCISKIIVHVYLLPPKVIFRNVWAVLVMLMVTWEPLVEFMWNYPMWKRY